MLTLTTNEQDEYTEAAAAELGRRYLYDFVKEAWKVVEPGKTFRGNWHIRLICETLERAHKGEIKRLIINIPPRCMKSTIISVMYPVWCWLQDPSHQFLSISHSGALATRDALKSRRLLQSPWFKKYWGDRFTLTGDQNQKTRYENDKRGYRIALGMTAGITGEGGDTILIDDPHDRDSAHSEAERLRALETYDEAISTRLNDPAAGKIIVIMQRLHTKDLTGHLLAGAEPWHHLRIPMEYEADNPMEGDPRTEDGAMLWPEHFTPAVVATLKTRLGAYGTAGQLQQRPSPKGGGIWKREHIRYWQTPPTCSMKILSVDASFKKTDDGSYVVIQVWGRRQNTLNLLDQVRARMGLPETLAAIRAMLNKHGGIAVKLIEDKANGPAIIDTLGSEIPGFVAVKTGSDSKEARAEAVAPLFEAGDVYIPGNAEFTNDLVEEWCAFPNAAHDDQVDATSQALRYLAGAQGGLFETAADIFGDVMG